MKETLQGLFNDLLESTSDAMGRLALSVTHDHQLAEDACQEAYFELYRALLKARPITDHHAWLRRVTINKALAQLAGRKAAGAPRPLEALNGLAATTTGGIDDPAQRAALADAIDQLPPDQHAGLWLKVIKGLSYQEIADALDCSKKTAWRRVQQGLLAVKAELARSEERAGHASPDSPRA